MKIKLSKSQWKFIGKKAGWDIDDVNDDDVCTEERLVSFFTDDGTILNKETFFIEGRNERERFEKLEQEVKSYISTYFDNPDDIDYETELINVS